MDLEGQCDPDMDSLVKPNTSASGTGSTGPCGQQETGSLGPCRLNESDIISEKQPLPDCDTIVPQTDLQLDLEKGHGAINGAITPKDVIVVTTEGEIQKTHMKFLRKREIVFCMIGGVAFLIGLIMTVVGLLIMQGKFD